MHHSHQLSGCEQLICGSQSVCYEQRRSDKTIYCLG